MIRLFTKSILTLTLGLFLFTGAFAGNGNKSKFGERQNNENLGQTQTSNPTYVFKSMSDDALRSMKATNRANHVFKSNPSKVPPVNDDICSAIELVAGAPALIGDNTESTVEAGEAAGSCHFGADPVDSTVWYYYVPTIPGDYTVTTDLTALINDDTQLAAYSSSNGTCSGTFTEIACNDDAGAALLSTMVVSSPALGDTIWVQVDGYQGTTGTFEIALIGPTLPTGSDLVLFSTAFDGPLNYANVPADQATQNPLVQSQFIENVGGTTMDSVVVTATLNGGAVTASSAVIDSLTPLVGAVADLAPIAFMAGSNYAGDITVSTTSQDDTLSNNSYNVDMTVSDTVLGREDAAAFGGQLSFSATNYIGNVINTFEQDTMTSITATFSPNGTYPISFQIALLDYNNGPGTSIIYQTPVLSLAAPGDITVPVPGIVLPAGDYWIGALEQGAFLPLATDTATSYAGVAVGGPLGGVNIDVRDFGFFETFMVKANFGDVVPNVLSAYGLANPADGAIVDISGNPNQLAVIDWDASSSSTGDPIDYTWVIDAPGGDFSNPLAAIASDNSGADTTLTLSFGQIDGLLNSLGVAIGDTAFIDWTVVANSFAAQLWASDTFTVGLIRNGLAGSRDFEAYNVNDFIGVVDFEWSTWSGTTGTPEDAQVTDAQSQSGVRSVVFTDPNTDAIFLMGDSTTGVQGAGFSMYVATGNSAYYNIQETQVPATRWVVEVNFDDGGTGDLDLAGITYTFNYPQNQWFDVRHYIDLDNDSIQIWINGDFVAASSYTQGAAGATTTLGSFDFFPAGGNGPGITYYVDDMYYQNDSLRTVPAPDYDAALSDRIGATGLAGYDLVPPSQDNGESFIIPVRNNGSMAVTNLTVTGNIAPGGSTVTGGLSTLGAFTGDIVGTNGFTANPGGSYTANFDVTITENDANPGNNTASLAFDAGAISDTIFARENEATAQTPVGFTGGTGRMGNYMEFTSADTITSITLTFGNAPTDPFEIFVAEFDYATTTLVTELYNSGNVTVGAAGTFTFGVNVPVAAGSYFVGVVQTATNNLGFGLTTNVIRDGTAFFGPVALGAMTDVNSLGIPNLTGTFMVKLGLGLTNQPITLTPFDLLTPPDNTRLEVAAGSTDPVSIDWDPTTASAGTPTYRWLVDVQGGNFANPILDFASDNGGVDPVLSLTSGAIDNELANLGLGVGDSVDVIWTVEATGGATTAFAANGPYNIKLVRVPLGISDALFNEMVSFYPNPTDGEIVLEVSNDIVETVVVQNLLGQTQRVFENIVSENVLNLSDLESGIYLLKFSTSEGEFTRKVVIE